jgi:hypothetical protein
MFRHSILIVLLLGSCKPDPGGTTNFPLGLSVDQLIHEPPFTYDFVDTAYVYDSLAIRSEKWWKQKRDTILRFAPVTFLSKQGILLAKIKDNKVYRYDFILDFYAKWKYPFIRLTGQEPRDKYPANDPIWKNLIEREYSNRIEFKFLANELRRLNGEPSQLYCGVDSAISWEEKGITLRLHNSRHTTVVSFYKPDAKQYLDYRDWQFTSLSPDTLLMSFPLGMKKSDVRRRIAFIDTLWEAADTTETFGIVPMMSWGIPGEATFVFDSEENLKRIIWESFGSGNRFFEGAFIFTGIELNERIKRSFPDHDQVILGHGKFLRWRKAAPDSFDAIDMVYYDPKRFMFCRASEVFLKDFEESFTSPPRR